MSDEVWYVQYVGKKARTRDMLFGTGTIWDGPGDIQPVSREAAVKMLNYPDAYKRVTAQAYIDLQESKEGDLEAEHEIGLEKARERVEADAAAASDSQQRDTQREAQQRAGERREAERAQRAQAEAAESPPADDGSEEASTPEPTKRVGKPLPKAPSQLTKGDCVAYLTDAGFDVNESVLGRQDLIQACINVRDHGAPDPAGAPAETESA